MRITNTIKFKISINPLDMSSEFPKIDHALTVNIFLGGATFTALFFLLQSKGTVQNYDLLVFLTAVTSILFILASAGRASISSGYSQSSIFSQLVGTLTIIGLFLIFGILSLLIVEVNFMVGVIVCIFAFALLTMVEIISRKSNRY